MPPLLHVGVLGHSADGAALCLLEIVRESARKLGDHRHPEVTLSILEMGPTLLDYERHNLPEVRAYLSRTARRLADAGCDFFICPDNTAHIALEWPGPLLPLPGLHIAGIVAGRARAEGRRRVALLGTTWTMTGPVYPAAFAREGIAMQTPPRAQQAAVNRIIFDELCQGIVREESQSELLRIIETMKRGGCDAVALSCTELPLAVTPAISPLPPLDSTRLLAHAAVASAIGGLLPAWRGGPEWT
jgi:aspartate racemase